MKKVKRYINNNRSYKNLSANSTTTNRELVDEAIKSFKKTKQLKERLAHRLKIENARTRKFCIQPNIQEKEINLINSPTSKISKFNRKRINRKRN